MISMATLQRLALWLERELCPLSVLGYTRDMRQAQQIRLYSAIYQVFAA